MHQKPRNGFVTALSVWEETQSIVVASSVVSTYNIIRYCPFPVRNRPRLFPGALKERSYYLEECWGTHKTSYGRAFPPAVWLKKADVCNLVTIYLLLIYTISIAPDGSAVALQVPCRGLRAKR